MEASVEAAKQLVSPQPSSLDSESAEGQATSLPQALGKSDPMDKLDRRLEDIICTYGSAQSFLQPQTVGKAEVEKMTEEAGDDITVAMETEISVVMQSLNKISSPEKKLENVVKKYAELAALRCCNEKKLCVLQQRFSSLLKEKEQLQAEQQSSLLARRELETLCRELYTHYNTLREETLQRCREDEEKRTEITSQFQTMLTDIQEQIEQHSMRNTNLCRENTNLTEKLESLMNQYERREESLEKINKHRDLQLKLTEAKLEQANALLADAQEKHKREKEYLLREAIDKTKKCCTMREHELTLKKKLLVQAAEWKLQAQQLKEQGTVMQAQLTLYSQKFDDFQVTLAKSNEIYAHFKQEMEKMTEKMKTMEKESNLWKSRFENCNKALTDMIEERTEKGKEFDLFVLKIQRLEKLCHALQDERIGLYKKIKEVCCVNSSTPSKVSTNPLSQDENPDQEAGEKSPLMTDVELLELQEKDPVLTEDMARLKEEQAKLQEFAASLLSTSGINKDDDKCDLDLEEDLVSSAFVHFKTQTQAKEKPLQPEQMKESQAIDVKSESEKPVPAMPVEVEEAQNQAVSATAKAEAATPEERTPPDTKAEAVEDKILVKEQEIKPSAPKQNQEIKQQPSELVSTPEPEKTGQPADIKPEAAEGKAMAEGGEVRPVLPVEAEKTQQLAETEQTTEGAPTNSESARPSKNNTSKAKAAATSNTDTSKKQAPKKKKKRSSKNAS
ncbi:hypothetical protein LDENG_00173750 [Lucifuga dentata]|nr:hypothetical protein LDENG_00173750 [Lucifuga dentata]